MELSGKADQETKSRICRLNPGVMDGNIELKTRSTMKGVLRVQSPP